LQLTLFAAVQESAIGTKPRCAAVQQVVGYWKCCGPSARLGRIAARNRSEFIQGRAEIEAFLARKWTRELDYRLIKEVWTYRDHRIAVRFAYEWHDDGGYWFRSYGNENWEFDEHGLMRLRIASINDLPIRESDRKYHWPLGRRPDDHPSLSELGL
jgi:uncharacterized protein